MHEAYHSVYCTVVILRTKLVVGEKRKEVNIREKPFRNDFLQELTTALKEADRSISLGQAVVGAFGFG
jgi:hypothetical protein